MIFDWFALTGVGSDVFGEVATGRNEYHDGVNDFLRTKALAEWFRYARENNLLREDFNQDLSRVNRQKMIWTPLWTLSGALFALTIWNPNFTNRSSYYLRKFSVLFFAQIGYQLGTARYEKQVLEISLKNYDHYPLAVRRTLLDKDFRHMVDFDYANAAKLHHPETRKTLD